MLNNVYSIFVKIVDLFYIFKYMYLKKMYFYFLVRLFYCLWRCVYWSM